MSDDTRTVASIVTRVATDTTSRTATTAWLRTRHLLNQFIQSLVNILGVVGTLYRKRDILNYGSTEDWFNVFVEFPKMITELEVEAFGNFV